MVGEATRMPFVEDIVKSVPEFKERELRRTLNTQEALANGCALHARYLQDREFFDCSVEDFNPHTITADIEVVSGDNSVRNVGQFTVFKRGCSFPSKSNQKKYERQESQPGEWRITLRYSDSSDSLLPAFTFKVENALAGSVILIFELDAS